MANNTACILLGNYVSTYMPKSYPDTCVVTGNVTLSHATVSRIIKSISSTHLSAASPVSPVAIGD